LSRCEDLLVKYGGHELAAGLTVKRSKIEEFRRRINEYANEQFTADMLCSRTYADCELEANEINMSFAEELQRLEPFGIGNATPQFTLKNARIVKITHIGGGKHTRLILEKDRIMLTAMYFGVGEGELAFNTGELVDALFAIDVNEYRGSRSVQLLVHDMRVAECVRKRLLEQKQRYADIRAGKSFAEDENVVPDRDDFACIYTVLRKEFRAGNDTMSIGDMQRLANLSGSEINYIKLKFILLILSELNICGVDEIDGDVYKFNVFFNAGKTSIERSSILKKLKGQCERRALNRET
jgi:single-stranded-DNA-specific exonuclease